MNAPIWAVFFCLCGNIWCGTFLTNHHDVLLPRGNLIVLVLESMGLANRLRAVADWFVVAKSSNRKLLLVWQRSTECNASFDDLFVSWPEQLLLWAPAASNIIDIEVALKERGLHTLVLTPDIMFYEDNAAAFILKRNVAFASTEVLLTEHNGLVSIEGMQCQQYLTLRSKFYQSIEPIAGARSIVADIRSRYFSNRLMVGIHYRAHVAEYDWEVVPPTRGATAAVRFGDGASVEDFTRLMAKIRFHFTVRVGESNDTNVRFFIASNSAEAKRQLLETFPDAITLPDAFMANESGSFGRQNEQYDKKYDYSRSTKDGMLHALVDWLLLAESALVINTYGSSFAEEVGALLVCPSVRTNISIITLNITTVRKDDVRSLPYPLLPITFLVLTYVQAAQKHMVPLVGIVGGIAFLHTNVRHPLCGHQLFLKEYGTGKQGYYVETDGGILRKVTS
jgi:hypothetical protein